MDFETISNVIALLAGGSGLGCLLTWQYTKRKAKAETESAEAAATKELQDIYQQLIADVKQDRDEQKTYINELKEDRQHLRDERDELRSMIDDLDLKVRSLERDVARNGRMVESMRPFLCSVANCPKRQTMSLSDVVIPTKSKRKKNDSSKEGRQGSQGSGDPTTAEGLS